MGGAGGGPLVLGVDIGTGSIKGVLATPEGEIVASATAAQRVSMPQPGFVEMDAETDWWDATCSIIHELTRHAPSDAIAGVCVSGLGPCLLLCDEADRPTRPAILYGIDMRAEAEISELTARLGAAEILARGGKALSSQAVGPKLLWVRRHEPDVWARSRRWYSSHSFIVARLTGEYVLDHHTASQNDPMYDLSANEWFLPWAEELAHGLELPRLAWPGELAGEVTRAAADACGLKPGIPVCAGTVDAWAEMVSAGLQEEGDMMLMYGSTMFIIQVVGAASPHLGLWTTTGVTPGSNTLSAGMATTGILTEWMRHLTGGASFEELVAEAARIPAGSDGLIVLPYFAGERAPIYDPDARGLIAGLTLGHHRGHLFRATYEGIAYGIRQILEMFAAAEGPPQRVVAVGGGTQGGLWTQIVTDVTGQPQSVPGQTIGASYGDALLAAKATNLTDRPSWANESRVLLPDPAVREVYDACFESYSAFYPLAREEMHRLASLQKGLPASAPGESVHPDAASR